MGHHPGPGSGFTARDVAGDSREAQKHQRPESKDSPQTSSQSSETQASSLESPLQERPLGELHVSLEIAVQGGK